MHKFAFILVMGLSPSSKVYNNEDEDNSYLQNAGRYLSYCKMA